MRMLSCSLLFWAGALIGAPVTCPPGSAGLPVAITSAGSSFVGTCQGLTFSDFDVVAAAGDPNPEVDLVGMSYDPFNVYLTFNPNMSAPPGSGPQDIWLFFSVTGPLLGIDVELGGRNATLVETACSSPTSPASPVCSAQDVLGQLLAFSAPFDNADSVLFAHVSGTTYIMKDIAVSDSGRGGALTEVRESFHYGAVPEPGTLLMGGAGLALVWFVRRRRA